MSERTQCTCHGISIDAFRAACASGAHNVKTCFKTIGCLPKCNNCIPMVRSVLASSPSEPSPAQPATAKVAVVRNALTQ